MEAREGIKPSNSGFADRRVITSPPRHLKPRADLKVRPNTTDLKGPTLHVRTSRSAQRA